MFCVEVAGGATAPSVPAVTPVAVGNKPTTVIELAPRGREPPVSVGRVRSALEETARPGAPISVVPVRDVLEPGELGRVSSGEVENVSWPGSVVVGLGVTGEGALAGT